jgi:NADH-quinone oxidoreductase subunit J
MEGVFWTSAALAVVSTAMVVTRVQPVHALLYLIVSLLAVAVIFFALGAPLIGALEVIVYAGAIIVLFLFVVMMLNLGPATAEQERRWLPRHFPVGPVLLGAVLVGELTWVLAQRIGEPAAAAVVGPKEVGLSLYGPYLIGVELVGMLLLAGLIGAYHIGRESPKKPGDLT